MRLPKHPSMDEPSSNLLAKDATTKSTVMIFDKRCTLLLARLSESRHAMIAVKNLSVGGKCYFRVKFN